MKRAGRLSPQATRCGERLSTHAFLLAVILSQSSGCINDEAVGRVAVEMAIISEAIGHTEKDRASLILALDRSIAWLESDDAAAFYPVAGFTRTDALAITCKLRDVLIDQKLDPTARIFHSFELIAQSDQTLVTGYYAPAFRGSRVRTDLYRYPLYAPPDELRGQREPDPPFATRREIEESNLLAGSEIVWLADPFDAYVVHVNGSARILLPDGSRMNVGHVSTNGQPYASIGRMLIDDGHISADEMSLAHIREFFEAHPERFQAYAWQNERYVFFEELPDDRWPRSALGIALVAERSVAIDPSIYPPGMPAILIAPLEGTASSHQTNDEAQVRFILLHDTGGAITGPGRVDYFFGVGDEAGDHAGALISHGKLLFLQPRE